MSWGGASWVRWYQDHRWNGSNCPWYEYMGSGVGVEEWYRERCAYIHIHALGEGRRGVLNNIAIVLQYSANHSS